MDYKTFLKMAIDIGDEYYYAKTEAEFLNKMEVFYKNVFGDDIGDMNENDNSYRVEQNITFDAGDDKTIELSFRYNDSKGEWECNPPKQFMADMIELLTRG